MCIRDSHIDMQGIVNGIDYEAYDPKTDAKIQTHYDSTDFRKMCIRDSCMSSGKCCQKIVKFLTH